MRHEMLTQRALFCHRANTKRGTLSQHFVTHVVPPLVHAWLASNSTRKLGFRKFNITKQKKIKKLQSKSNIFTQPVILPTHPGPSCGPVCRSGLFCVLVMSSCSP